jgi:hypothetical protein
MLYNNVRSEQKCYKHSKVCHQPIAYALSIRNLKQFYFFVCIGNFSNFNYEKYLFKSYSMLASTVC